MITTLTYGHHALQEEMFIWKNLRDPHWSSSDDEETNVHFAESTTEHSPPITQHTQLPEAWSPPDPGFNQREYSEDEDDIVNFANFTQQESEGELEKCSFIDDQAIELGSLPSLLDLRPTSPIHLSTNTSTQKQSIHRTGTSTSMDSVKRTLELISDDESINVERVKKRRVVIIDSDSEEN